MRAILIAVVCALLAATGVLLAAGANAEPAQQDLRTQDVEFQSNGLTLHGTVYLPSNAGNDGLRRPGIVLVHGSGPGPRAKYVPEAEAFARAGIVTLVYDKRTDGYSVIERDYAQLADDALAGVQTLRARPDVDPAKVGLWGLSEGGWVVPMAAAKSPEVAFIVTIGGSGQPPLRQQTWSLDNMLRRHGVSGSLLDAVAPGGEFLSGLGLYPEADHDSATVLRQVHQPVLALWGEHDTQVPPAESAQIFQQALAGNPHTTIRFVPGAGHNGHRTSDGFDRVGGLVVDGHPLGAMVPGYADVITAWIDQVVAGNPPLSSLVGPVPHQEALSRAPSGGAWYETAPVGNAAVALLLLGFLSYPLTTRLRRADHVVSQTRSVRRWARWLTIFGLGAVIGAIAYLVWILGFAGPTESAFLGGQPLTWLVLHILSLLVILTALATAFTWWRARTVVTGVLRVRLTLLLVAAAVFLPWALYWRLFLP
ncbi:prolyl oligopeptidase family serine peptidase [Nocardia sp. NBC_01499]|uniref:alpha/beta hydrolase family protein n=1 Tax=Nocardia sp. NBC_01499 TaxID=2903597 RepID=UPI003870CC0D